MTDTEKRDTGDILDLLEESQTNGCTLSGDDCRMILEYIDNRIDTVDRLFSELLDIGRRARKAAHRIWPPPP